MPTFQQFLLPDAGEGLTEAEIVAWHVVVGDRIAVNQVLVEIETAKSVVDLPSPYAGLVTALHADPGVTVPVGAPIVTIDTDPDGAANGSTTAEVVDGGAEVVDGGAEVVTSTRDREPEVTTSRAGHDPAPETAGDPVLVGYGVVGAPTRRRARPADGAVPGPATPPARGAASARVPAAVAPAATPPTAEPPVLAKPPVRKLAKDLGVDLAGVSATGPGGIVTREDVLAHAEAARPRGLATYPGDDAPWLASGSVSADGRQTRVPVKSVRRRTAEAMVASAFTAPHVTVFHTLDVTRTMRLVAQLKEDKEFAGVHVTPLLVAAKALLMAVRRHPEINASWDERSQEIVYKHYVNLGIAAATPRGLVVPNIKDAHRMGLHDLAVALSELTSTARAGRTTPVDMADGTITITNVGVFGIDTGTPILNPGEAAILAFGAIRSQPWVHKGKVKPRWVTQLALSFDHRLVDGELGSRVLADVAALLGDPAKAMVWG